jgi:hypothetical protein
MSETTVPICNHVKTNGVRCASPAVTGTDYCYYHLGARHCLPVSRGMFVEPSPNLKDAPPMPDFPMPFFDDPGAIQIGYMQTVYGIASKRLDPGRARLILSALNGASRNLKRMEIFVNGTGPVSPKEGKKQALALKQAQARVRNQRKAKA